MRRNRFFLLFVAAVFIPSQLPAQTHKALTVEEAVKRDINGTEEQRTKQFPPYRIIGNIYYVGAETQASFLVSTSQGLILINSNFEKSVPEIKNPSKISDSNSPTSRFYSEATPTTITRKVMPL